ncbi:CUE domain-containing protein [Anaerobacillus sp. MEB173]|uniref:CUE domain-containing protein n=1 Tax=Anaerobacillus sp. MEB173 TaxID=3383345 RepID=UPI003F930E64
MSKMKKRIIAVLATFLVLGAGTTAIASTDVFEDFTFENMLPFMKQMHPNMDEEQLQGMYETCHGENGMMNRMPVEQRQQMMNRYQGNIQE